MINLNSKIGIISFDFDPPIGGQGTYVKNIVDYLDKSSVDYIIFSTASNSLKNHVHIRRFGNRNFGPIFFSFYATFLINKWVKKYSIDIVDIQSGPGGVMLLRKPIVPTFFTIHMLYSEKAKINPSLKYKLLFLLEKLSFRKADKIIATSAKMQDEIIDKYSIVKHRVTYVLPGIDLQIFKPKRISKKRGKLICVGRLDKNKRVKELIGIICKLRQVHPFITLDIIGEGPENQNIVSEINNLRANKFIRYLGVKTKNQLPKIYSEGMLLILPSKYEAFGLVACEALACNTPAIVPQSSGIAEIVFDSKVWSSFDGTLEDLKIKISTFLCEAHPCAQDAPRKISETYFDSNKNIRKTLRILSNE
jgi:glycosyltransferase involved in cell wall biosynthesis